MSEVDEPTLRCNYCGWEGEPQELTPPQDGECGFGSKNGEDKYCPICGDKTFESIETEIIFGHVRNCPH